MNLYLVPVETVTVLGKIKRGPRYFSWRFTQETEPLNVTWTAMDYGFVPSMLLHTPDITVEQHNTLIIHADVYDWPDNLDQSIAPADTIDTFLEAINIPTDWLTPSTTYRELLRALAGMFAFNQRYSGIAASTDGSAHSIFDNATLATRLNQLTGQEQTWFLQTVSSFGIDPNIVPLNAQLRQLVRQAGNYWGEKPFNLGGFVF